MDELIDEFKELPQLPTGAESVLAKDLGVRSVRNSADCIPGIDKSIAHACHPHSNGGDGLGFVRVIPIPGRAQVVLRGLSWQVYAHAH